MGSESFTESIEQSEQLGWLVWSLREARIRSVPDQELFHSLRRGPPQKLRQPILKEIERRLDYWSGTRQRSLVAILNRLHQGNSKPGPAAQEVDKLLRRLLWQLRGTSARALALSCVGSTRLQRRMAAWRFFGHHGLDGETRTLLAERVTQESHRYFFRLLAFDSELLDRVGLRIVVAAQDDFYWRGRALETHLAAGNQPGSVASSFPGEAIFAIRRSERTDLIPLAAKLLRDNRSAPRVVSAAIQCFGALDLPEELAEAEAAGRALLEGAPELTREVLSLDEVLAELNRGVLDP